MGLFSEIAGTIRTTKHMVVVSKLTGASNDEVDDMYLAVRDAARLRGVNTEGLAEACVPLAKMGDDPDVICASLMSVGRLADAAGVESVQAARWLVETAGVFAIEPSHRDEIVEYAQLAVEDVGGGGLTYADFFAAARVIGSSAAHAGHDYASVSREISNLAEQGVVGRSAGMRLRHRFVQSAKQRGEGS